jgi:hypothetical protein
MNGRGRCDKNEMAKRVRAVQEWILQGQFTCDIISQLTTLYKITERQAYNIYNKAWTGIQKNSEGEKEAKKFVYIQTLKKLYRDLEYKTKPSGARAALRIVEGMARMEGILPIRENQSGFNPDVFGNDDNEGAIMKLSDGTEIEI